MKNFKYDMDLEFYQKFEFIFSQKVRNIILFLGLLKKVLSFCWCQNDFIFLVTGLSNYLSFQSISKFQVYF